MVSNNIKNTDYIPDAEHGERTLFKLTNMVSTYNFN
jgi:hypothetical protein